MDDKTFWEYFGFEHPTKESATWAEDVNDWWLWPGLPTYARAELPKFTLDNLFKYCVPKLFPKTFMMETCDDGYEFAILSDKPSGGVWCHWDKDPAQALRKAIEKAIE